MENKKTYEKNPFEIGLFWKHISKKGNEYFSGQVMLGGQEYKLTLFKCKGYKEGGNPNIPYYNVLLQDPNYKKNQESKPVEQEKTEDEVNVEEIPF